MATVKLMRDGHHIGWMAVSGIDPAPRLYITCQFTNPTSLKVVIPIGEHYTNDGWAHEHFLDVSKVTNDVLVKIMNGEGVVIS